MVRHNRCQLTALTAPPPGKVKHSRPLLQHLKWNYISGVPFDVLFGHFSSKVSVILTFSMSSLFILHSYTDTVVHLCFYMHRCRFLTNPVAVCCWSSVGGGVNSTVEWEIQIHKLWLLENKFRSLIVCFSFYDFYFHIFFLGDMSA